MEDAPAISAPQAPLHTEAPWPYAQLDLDALRSMEWQPSPLREFVLKIHQRCNLACDYCYVYTMADQSWRNRPKVMSREVWAATADRIAEHADRHGLDEVRVVLHGGEPLLAGIGTIVEIARAVRRALPAGVTAWLAMQTNGVLLDNRVLSTLRDHDIRVGVSLDGTGPDHDRHRVHLDGRGSFAAVDRALRLLGQAEYRTSFTGILATIDPRSDPVACYETLLRYEPPAMDFLLPHANWSAPHPAGVSDEHPFGSWLVQIFDRWYGAPYQETRLRFFEEVINVILGGASRAEDVGLSRAVVAIVESDGAIEQLDSLKSTYEGAASTGLSVLTDMFDHALRNPGIAARQIGVEALSDACRRCPIHRICGGGLYPHRYRAGVGFRNPSVYCADLWHVINHIRRRITSDLGTRPEPTE